MQLELSVQASGTDQLCCRCLDRVSKGVLAVSADGTIRCANAAAAALVGVAKQTIVGASVDLLVDADRRDELRSLVAEERSSFLSYLLDRVGQAIVTTDVDGRVDYWNRMAELLYGCPADEAVGRPLGELVTDDRGREFTNLAATDSAWSGEIDARRRDGTTVPVFVTLTPIDAATSFGGLLVVSHDLTEQRQLQSRLRRSERLEGIGRLAGGVAHDFNNLLTIILNYGGDIEATTEGDIRDKAASIVAAGESAARLTRQLLAFARQEPARRGPLDLNTVIAEAMELFRRIVGGGVRLAWIPTGLPLVTADRGQIEQVLLNLTVNARDAMPGGGTLTIDTDVVDLDEAYVRLHPDAKPGRYVRLSVTDTGTGTPPEVAARAFEPFFTTKRSGEGTGLGLATVYGVVVDGGGTVNLYSEPGLGTTVRVYLPVARPDDAVTATRREPAAGSRPRADVDGALRLSKDNRIDLLLSDVIMPGLTGPDLARALLDRTEAELLAAVASSLGAAATNSEPDERAPGRR